MLELPTTHGNLWLMGPVAGNEGSTRILLPITISLLLYPYITVVPHYYIIILMSLITTSPCRVNMAISLWIFCSLEHNPVYIIVYIPVSYRFLLYWFYRIGFIVRSFPAIVVTLCKI